jgi:type I restriction enzyme S subunit
MSVMIRLGSLIEKAHIKCRDFDGVQELEAFGISNTEGIVCTAHRKSDDLGEYLVIEPGSFAYNPYRVNVGSIGLTSKGVFGVVSPAYVVFRAKERKLVPEVLLDFLKSFEGLRQINKLARGAVRKALRYEDLCEIEFPAISYERQLEILEYKRSFNKQHANLLSEISYQESLLPKLKQAILQEAIQGKLTADWRAANPDVEPASQLLRRIQTEKARLIAVKKLRAEKPLPKITPDEIPFEIPKGWEWSRLGSIGYVGTGATPATENKAYYEGGTIPWITSSATGAPFVEKADAMITERALRETNCTIYPEHTLLVAMYGQGKTRGQVTELLISAATNQACAAIIFPNSFRETNQFAKLVIRENYHRIRELAQGGSQPNLNLSKIKNSLIPLPPLAEQKVIVEKVEALMTACRALEAEIEHTRTHAAHLLQAVLREAFSGELVAQKAQDKPAPAETDVIPFPVRVGNISATDLHAGILARAYQHHAQNPKNLVHFGHVKAEKIAHLVEAHLGIDLERVPVKAAAGPNDYPHLKKVESRAKKANWFDVRQQKADGAYIFHKQHGFDALLGKSAQALGDRATEVDALINLLLPLNTRQAEIVATLYAAWNNLLLLGRSPSDEEIVYEARENWHASKLGIEREKFFKSLEWMRKQELVPVGRGRYVDTK